MYDLLDKAIDTVKPAIAFISAGACYVILPNQSFVAWCIALWIAMFLDVLTRWFAIFIKSKGIKKAFKTNAWNSEAMFKKTGIKIVSYLVIQILAGLSIRFLDIPYISTAVANVIYAFLFFRELASNIENLIDAGAEGLEPFLFWVKKKSNKALEISGDLMQEELSPYQEECLPEGGENDDN